MSAFEVAGLVIVVIWAITAAMLAVVMGRRGYSSWGWGIIGAALGPVAVVVALLADIPQRADRVLAVPSGGTGTVDVLVGVDGSTGSVAAALGALNLIGDRVGRLTFVGVAPIDATTDEERQVVLDLSDAKDVYTSQFPAGVNPGVELLHGRPSDALRRHAIAGDYETIALGSHGRGASTALLGSTAAALVRESPVPLLISNGHVVATAVVRGLTPVEAVA